MGPAKQSPGSGTVGTIRVVTSFYSQVLGSPVLYNYFAGVPIEVLIAKQAAFIDTVVQGNPGYAASELHQLHAHLNIDDDSFDELLRILDGSLKEHEYEADGRAVILASFESFRQAIVSKVPE